jgi:hypothetical protein
MSWSWRGPEPIAADRVAPDKAGIPHRPSAATILRSALAGRGMQSNPEPELTLSKVNLMAFAAQEGRARRSEAKLLLALFCQCVEGGDISARSPGADRLLEHVRESLRAYLNGKRTGNRDHKTSIGEIKIATIESAFGLARRRGQPKADEHSRMQMAAAVVRQRLTGISHQEAVEKVAEEFGKAESIVGDAFSAHRCSGVVMARLDRADDPAWSDTEIRVLRIILGHENETLLREIRELSRCDTTDIP